MKQTGLSPSKYLKLRRLHQPFRWHTAAPAQSSSLPTTQVPSTAVQAPSSWQARVWRQSSPATTQRLSTKLHRCRSLQPRVRWQSASLVMRQSSATLVHRPSVRQPRGLVSVLRVADGAVTVMGSAAPEPMAALGALAVCVAGGHTLAVLLGAEPEPPTEPRVAAALHTRAVHDAAGATALAVPRCPAVCVRSSVAHRVAFAMAVYLAGSRVSTGWRVCHTGALVQPAPPKLGAGPALGTILCLHHPAVALGRGAARAVLLAARSPSAAVVGHLTLAVPRGAGPLMQASGGGVPA